MAVSAKPNFNAEDWERISGIEDPEQFMQPFVMKVSKLSKNIKEMYENGEIEENKE